MRLWDFLRAHMAAHPSQTIGEGENTIQFHEMIACAEGGIKKMTHLDSQKMQVLTYLYELRAGAILSAHTAWSL